MTKRGNQFGGRAERAKLRSALNLSQNGCCKNCGDVIWFIDEVRAEDFLADNPTCHPDDINTRSPSLHMGEQGPELWCLWCKTDASHRGEGEPQGHLKIRIVESGVMEAVASNGSWVRVPKAAADEILRCHERLEIDRVWRFVGKKLEREDVPFSDRLTLPDGIECRDATIRLIEAN